MKKALLFSIALGFAISPIYGNSHSYWRSKGVHVIALHGESSELQRQVSGVVRDKNGPLSGVTVRVIGKSGAAQTNDRGEFTIQASDGDKLRFSIVGHQSKEVTVVPGKINVTLVEDTGNIEEVVVTAYGITRDKKSLGYSTPIVDGSDVAETQREGFFNGLAGRVPGLSINSTNGAPGASAQIVLRGFTSISGENNALIVIDGVPVDNSTVNENDLAYNTSNRDNDYSNRALDINPEDIESYTIMKGPEATALFGNQGAGGAILITTKKAKSGRGSVSYNNSFRWETFNRWPERQLTYGPGTNGVYSAVSTLFFGPKYPEGTQIYDNIGAFFRTGFTQKHNLGLESGSEKLSYRWSNEYSDNLGVTPNTRYTRFSSRLGATANITDKLKLQTSFNYINSDNDKARRGANGYLISLLRFNPSLDMRNWIDELGNRVTTNGTIYGEYDNPFWDTYKNTSYDKVNRFLANTNIRYDFTNWLSVTGILGLDYSTTHGESVYHAQSYRGSGSAGDETGGRFQQYDKSARIITGSLTARATRDWGNYNATFILGSSFDMYDYDTESQYGEKFYDPNFYNINNTSPETRNALSVYNQYRNVGWFGQWISGYKSILFLTLSARLDGASRLNGPKSSPKQFNPYFAYPSASLAFNFGDLKYLKENLPWLDDGKLRSSVSLTGKQPFRTYSLGNNLEGSNATGGGYKYSYYGGNPNLKKETTEDFEVGLELAILKRRATFDFTYYTRNSIDQIINPRISYGSGFVLQMMNGGTVSNKGFEAQVKVNPIRKKEFNWDITFNYTQNKGMLTYLPSDLPALYDSDTWVLSGLRTAAHPGYSTGTVSGTQLARNDHGDILIDPATGLPYISDATYYPIGDRTPKFMLGTINKFRYKNWSLSFLWDLRVGGDVVNGTEYEMYSRGNSVKTLDREKPRIITGVLKDGLENTANPTKNQIALTPYYNYLYYSTNIQAEMFVERDINALRLRDVTLNYELPKAVAQRLGKNTSLGLFFTATDLFLISNYSGMDPESNMNNASLGGIGGYGMDYGNIGKPIGFNVGLRLKL